MKPLKFAHTEGHTDVCYDSSGSFILTGGSDGKVCIWEGTDDTDTTNVSVGDKIFAIAFQGDRIFAATDENAIRIHTFPDGVGDGMVTRFTAPCRHFSLCEDGSMLVAGSDDFKLKVIAMEENECICLYSEHQAPILGVAIDPTREFIASSSCDGTVKIWNIMDGSTEKTLNLFPKCSEPSQAKSLCRMCWSQDGEFLLIPVNTEIHLYLRSSWEVVRKVSSSEITETINVMAMCPDGKHVAAGCINGDIGIFEWQTNKLVEKHSHPKHLTVTSFAWNPQKWSELAFCDNMGQLGFLDIQALKDKVANKAGSQPVNRVAEFDDRDDDLLVSASQHQANGDSADIDDVDKYLEDDENSIDIGSIKRSLNPLIDNEDADSMTSSKADGMPVPSAAPALSLPANIFKPTPLQPPFQSGSTPEHLSSRFMVWNSIGIVRQYVSDDENSIDVEFHDTSTHHALHLDNKSDYVMADLSTQAVLFASRGDEEGSSKLLCMHFGSWDTHKEWSFDMPPGENIQAIAVTDTWAAIATESRFVRIFSIGGLQRQIFSIPGNVVTLASHGNKLLVVYHKGMGVPGDQYLGILILRVRGHTKSVLVKDDTLPLSPASKLAWIGFSEEGTPYFMDTAGVVKMYNRHFSSTWFPTANTKQHAKGKSDHYWLVSINERQQQIRCVPCKGSRYPATLPRPALAVLPFQLPFCDMDSEKTQYEESYERSHLFAKVLADSEMIDEEEIQRPMREALVKLFAFAAKSERDFRALEVCDLMEDQSLLHIAATYATRLKRIQLAERVSEVMHKRQEMADQGIGNEQVESEDDEEDFTRTENYTSRPAQEDEDDEEDMNVSSEDHRTEDQDNKGPFLKTAADKETKSRDRPSGRPNPFKRFESSEKKSTKGAHVFDKMEKTKPKASPLFAPLPVSIKKSNSNKKSNNNQAKLTGFRKDDKTPAEEKPAAEQERQSGGIKHEPQSQLSQEEKSENTPMKKKVSGFDLWLEANKEDMKEEHPELSEEDLGQKAAESFRALPKEERQEWVQKAKMQSDSDSSKKRKHSDGVNDKVSATPEGEGKKVKTETSVNKKTPLSQATNAKLAKFAKTD